MTATQRFLEAVKERHSLTSNYQVAKLLDVSRAAVGLQVNGKVGMGDDQAIKVAELLDLDPLEVLAELYAERAPTDRARDYWHQLAEKARRTAAMLAPVILSALLSGFIGPGQAHASTGYGADRDLEGLNTSYTLCAVRDRAKMPGGRHEELKNEDIERLHKERLHKELFRTQDALRRAEARCARPAAACQQAAGPAPNLTADKSPAPATTAPRRRTPE